MAKYWEDIIRRVSVEDVILRYSGQRPNRSHFVCCPIHGEKTPSLSVKETKWHCFGCGKGGNCINFVMEYFKQDFKTACMRINEDFNLGLPINYNNLTTEEKIKWKEERRKEAYEKHKREEYLKWRDKYLNDNVNVLLKTRQELEEFKPVFYKDTEHMYTQNVSRETIVGGVTLHLPEPYKNFHSELIDDEDFDELVTRYIHLIKTLDNIENNMIPSEEQLKAIYNSRRTGFYINN